MKNRVRRARKLLQVQSQLLLTERIELEALKDTLAQAQKDERDALSFLSDEKAPAVPPPFLVRRAASSAARIRTCESLLQTQMEKTLDHARREQLVKRKLDSAYETLSRNESRQALQIAIDAYLGSSLKQDQSEKTHA